MPGQGFVRFNLHNSIGCYPAELKILQPLVSMNEEELRDWLWEIDQIQKERSTRLQIQYANEIEVLKGKKVLFLGDSITNDNLGYRPSVSQAAELNALNASISGGTVSMLLPLAKSMIEREKPDIVSLMVGANDSICLGSEDLNQVSPEEYQRDVSAILSFAKQSDTRILLFEITPVLEDRFEKCFSVEGKIQSNSTIQRYNRLLKEVAEFYDVKLVSHTWLFEGEKLSSLYEDDGIHLSVLGQERFAAKWLVEASNLMKS